MAMVPSPTTFVDELAVSRRSYFDGGHALYSMNLSWLNVKCLFAPESSNHADLGALAPPFPLHESHQA
jgi:hypothetical protein